MKTEKLTKIERLQLSNQFRILHSLTEDESYAIKAEIVEHGYEGLYDDIFETIYGGISEDICEETGLILHMFRIINNAYARLSDVEKEQIDVERIKFQGFDANNDQHYSYMKFLVEKMDMWDEHKNTYLNSHDSLPIRKYRKMLDVYNELGGDSNNNYSVKELIRFQEAL